MESILTTPDQPLCILDFLEVEEFLSAELKRRRSHFGRYSYETYSSDLGFGRNSYIHQIIFKTRPLTAKAGRRIADGLALHGEDRKYFMALVQYAAAKKPTERDARLRAILDIRAGRLVSDLDRAQVEYFSEWYHPVVRELVTFADFSTDPAWIARHVRPKIKPEEAAHSFRLLQRIGYVVFDPETNRWSQAENKLTMPHEVGSLVLMRYHQQMIDRARDSVTQVGADEREIGALTLTVSAADFRRLKARVQDFRQELVRDYGQSQEVQRVVQLNLQLFPMTELGGNDDEGQA